MRAGMKGSIGNGIYSQVKFRRQEEKSVVRGQRDKICERKEKCGKRATRQDLGRPYLIYIAYLS